MCFFHIAMSHSRSYTYHFSDVKPSGKNLDEFLRLRELEKDHPALIFLDEIMPELENSVVVRGEYVVFDIREIRLDEGEIEIQDVVFSTGRQVCAYLRGAEQAALFLCTAGDEISRLSGRFTADGNLLEAYLVDAIGSLTVENAMDKIMDDLEQEQKAAGWRISNRYSPGYCNWELSEQKKLFRLMEGNHTGITLTDSCLMIPRKSVSGIIGIGKSIIRRDYGCDICHNAACIYRKIRQSGRS